MTILVLNSGSSSIKFSLYRSSSESTAPEGLADGQLSGIGTPEPQLELKSSSSAPAQPPHSVQAKTPAQAIQMVLDAATASGMPSIDAIGYRVVHPGPKLRDHTRITPNVLAELEHAVSFAPLHDPETIALIREAMARFPHIGHFACFDTIFHQTMPASATTYPVPQAIRDQGVHRYGFHGLSCESAVYQLRAAAALPFPNRMIIAHLGSGSSVTALYEGRSVDTTMGLTPTGGVLMGTRPGDLDPGLLFYLLRQPGASVDSVEQRLNHDSGLKSLAGSGDVRKLRESSPHDPDATLALDIFCRRIRMAIAGFAAVHGLDALVFTGGIGEHDAATRVATAHQLFANQPRVDDAANTAQADGLRKISAADSIPVYIVPAEEDLMIARHVARMAA